MVRVDRIGLFEKGHCFISDVTLNGNPTFYLSSNVPSGAKDRIRDAFNEFNGIVLIHTQYQMGADFVETSFSAGADVIVRWIPLPSNYFGGQATLSETGQSYLDFDSNKSGSWSWIRSTNSVPDDKWHFYSVALHEVGHVYGLGHQPASETDDLMNGPVGEPLIQGGRHFDQVDDDSVFGVVRLYTQPIPPPPPPCVITVAQWCNGDSPQANVTPTLAGYNMTNIDMDYRLNGSSNWYPIYDGSPTCPIYNPPSNFMSSGVNALVTTATGYVTGCTVNVVPIWCGNGDPL